MRCDLRVTRWDTINVLRDGESCAAKGNIVGAVIGRPRPLPPFPAPLTPVSIYAAVSLSSHPVWVAASAATHLFLTTDVSLNQDGGFSFFRTKERESPRKRERKPGLRIRRRKKTPSASATRKSGVLLRLIPQNRPARLATERPCTGYAGSPERGLRIPPESPPLSRFFARPCGIGKVVVLLLKTTEKTSRRPAAAARHCEAHYGGMHLCRNARSIGNRTRSIKVQCRPVGMTG